MTCGPTSLQGEREGVSVRADAIRKQEKKGCSDRSEAEILGSSFSRVPSQAAAKDGGVFLSSPRKDVSARGMLLRADAAADLTHSLSTDISMERRENTAQSSTLLTVFFPSLAFILSSRTQQKGEEEEEDAALSNL